jgi:nucleoside-diphosphate-sugar epimerase
MKVAVLGSRGFVGSSLSQYFDSKYQITPITRDVLDLLDPYKVKDFLKVHKFDVILNCAAVMTDNNSLHDVRNNLGIFMNFYDNSDYFGKFINTGSGAEFDRETDINNASEDLIFDRLPKDSYGFGQNIKSRLCYKKNNFYTLRIFNCFGLGEQSTRLFPRIISSTQELKIDNDRYFDYFSIQDLSTVVENCIENDWKIKDCNCSYEEKYKISDAARLFCNTNNINKRIFILSESSKNYNGNPDNLKSLGINLLGLEESFKKYFKKRDDYGL